MSKRLIPFQNPRMWENNPNCLMCNSTDVLYNKILNETNEDQIQKTLEFLDEYCVVDGYDVLKVYEKNGYGLYEKHKIQELGELKVLREDGDNPDQARLVHSRWCIMCGSRKPDIYDGSREINE